MNEKGRKKNPTIEQNLQREKKEKWKFKNEFKNNGETFKGKIEGKKMKIKKNLWKKRKKWRLKRKRKRKRKIQFKKRQKQKEKDPNLKRKTRI